MSGLAGIFLLSGEPDVSSLPAMLRALDARGPDARTEVRIPEGGLGATVLTPDTGPAGDPGGRWLVAIDGEWVNERALRQELVARERGGAETSAAIAATIFAEIGLVRGIARLRGDAALVAWDAGERCLWLVRDRTGQRPLHWTRLRDGTILVASEVRALLAHPQVPRRADPASIAAIRAFGAVPAPATPWRDIHAVRPGVALRFDTAGVTEHEYWTAGANPPGAHGARNRWARSVQFGFELAVQSRASGPGPVAVALSGGAFSTAILGSVVERRREPVLALTFGDVPEAKAAAAAARADHVELTLRPEEVPELLDEASREIDVPLVDPAFLAWWLLARAAWSRGCRTLLGGDGGTELFLADTPPGTVLAGAAGPLAQRVARALGDSPIRRHSRRRGGLGAGDPADWAALDALPCPTTDPVAAAGWLDRRVWLPERVHLRADRVGAAHGLRIASPLADPDFVALVAGMPVGQVASVRRPRGLFLDAMEARLPTPPPPPRAMDVPVAAWLANPALTTGLAEALEGLVPGDEVRRLVAALPGGALTRVWSLVALARWRAAGWAALAGTGG